MVGFVIYAIFFCGLNTVLCASGYDEITVYNTTSKKLYAQCCYIKDRADTSSALPASDVILVEPCSQISVARPPRKYHWTGWYHRFLQVTEENPLLHNFVITDTSVLINIGTAQGSFFFLD